MTGCDYVRDRVNQWGDWDVNTMVAIAQAESNCRVDAVGDGALKYYQNGREYGYSIGALQVRILPGREHCEQSENYWQCAHDIWESQGYRAWSCFTNNRYKDFL